MSCSYVTCPENLLPIFYNAIISVLLNVGLGHIITPCALLCVFFGAGAWTQCPVPAKHMLVHWAISLALIISLLSARILNIGDCVQNSEWQYNKKWSSKVDLFLRKLFGYRLSSIQNILCLSMPKIRLGVFFPLCLYFKTSGFQIIHVHVSLGLA